METKQEAVEEFYTRKNDLNVMNVEISGFFFFCPLDTSCLHVRV